MKAQYNRTYWVWTYHTTGQVMSLLIWYHHIISQQMHGTTTGHVMNVLHQIYSTSCQTMSPIHYTIMFLIGYTVPLVKSCLPWEIKYSWSVSYFCDSYKSAEMQETELCHTRSENLYIIYLLIDISSQWLYRMVTHKA